MHELSNLRVIMSDEFMIQDIYDHKTNEEISEELNVYSCGLQMKMDSTLLWTHNTYIYFQVSRSLAEET